MLSKQTTAPPVAPTLTPRTELPGYDLLTQDSLATPNGFTFAREQQKTNTTGQYGIVWHGRRVGSASLDFGLRRGRVDFDVLMTERGKGLGVRALGDLALTLSGSGLDLVTSAIMPDSRPYWERMATEGHVVAIDNQDPNTQYRVLPTPPPVPPPSTPLS